jgi:hypothetical protein
VQLKHWLVGLSVVVAACGGDSTEAKVGVSGSVSFSYTGAGSTSSSYSASGTMPANPSTSFGSAQWAAGSTATAGEVDVAAAIPRSSTTWDIAAMTIARTTAGSSTINPNCTTACTEVTFLVGATQTETSFTFVCSLTSGTVAIATISATRATGTFSGSGSCFTSVGATSAFTITNGSFDVGLTSVKVD